MSSADFLQNYLEHLERKSSREGLNKWLLIVAFAAISWKLLDIAHSADLLLALRLIAVISALYFVVELIAQEMGDSDGREGTVRVFRASIYAGATSKFFSTLVLRFALTSYVFYAFFSEVGLWFRIAISAPIGFFALIGFFVLIRKLREKHEAVVPKRDNKLFNSIFIFFFAGSVCYGLYGVFISFDPVEILIDPGNIGAVKVVALGCASWFIANKYLQMLRVDSEVVAVRRLWQRFGIGEISPDDAMKELRLIVAGASLSETISEDVANLVQVFGQVEAVSVQSDKEIGALQTVADDVSRHALRNSLCARKARLEELETELDSSMGKVKRELLKLLGSDGVEHDECADLVKDLESRCAQHLTVARAAKERIDAVCA